MSEKRIERLSRWLKEHCQRLSAWLNQLSNEKRKGLILGLMALVALLLVLQSAWALYMLQKSREESSDPYHRKWEEASALLDAQSDRLEHLTAPLSPADSATCDWLRETCRNLEEQP